MTFLYAFAFSQVGLTKLVFIQSVMVTPTTFWLKRKNLPKGTKFCSTRKLEIAAKNFGLTKNPSHTLANTGA